MEMKKCKYVIYKIYISVMMIMKVTKYSDVSNGRSSYMYDHFNILISQVHAKVTEIS